MTREEAIQEFQNVKDLIRQDGKDWFDERDLEIIDMAIEALSADTVPIEKYHELQHQFVMLGATFADLTKVVRCKDCLLAQDDTTHLYCSYFCHKVYEDDFFCAYGERREP